MTIVQAYWAGIASGAGLAFLLMGLLYWTNPEPDPRNDRI
jgi:hypothetical protein